MLLLLLNIIMAEYRVYQYLIENPRSTVVLSTLAPSYYLAYHGNQIPITLLDSWMCYGNTSRKELCDLPVSKLIQDKTIP